MIQAKQLSKWFENEINGGAFTFKIFTDTGKYKKAIRKHNKITPVINGLYSVQSSDIEDTNTGLTVATITSRIEFVVPCLDDEEDVYQTIVNEDGTTEKTLIQSGNETYLSLIRQRIDEVCSKNYYQTMQDNNGTSYDVSVTYSLESTGTRQQLNEAGDSYSFVVYAYYNAVVNGDNSRAWVVYLDGERIPYLAMTIRRVPSQNANVYNGIDTTRNVMTSTTFSISMECPSIIGKFNKTIKNYLLNGERNVAHILTVIANDTTQNYLVLFGETDASSQGVLNVGHTLTFGEAYPLYGVISFPETYYIYSALDIATINVSNLAIATMKPFQVGVNCTTIVGSGTFEFIGGDIVASSEQLFNTSLELLKAGS